MKIKYHNFNIHALLPAMSCCSVFIEYLSLYIYMRVAHTLLLVQIKRLLDTLADLAWHYTQQRVWLTSKFILGLARKFFAIKRTGKVFVYLCWLKREMVR